MATYYSTQRRGREPVVAAFCGRRLPDGSFTAGILAVAERVQEEVELIEQGGKRRVRVRLPEEAVKRGTPIIMKDVRMEEIS